MASRRLAETGPNALQEGHRRSGLVRFLDQFRNVLVYILAVPTVLAISLGHWLDAAVILAVVIANAVIGWLQEGRAEQALAAVGRLLAAGAVVMRDGSRKSVAAADIVPGDVVFLESGDRIPGDVRLFETRGLSVDESLLTGESLPAQKSGDPVPAEAPLAERSSMAFSGTIVTGGQAFGLVVGTGSATELGHIGRLVEGVSETSTPFLDRLSRTSRQLTVVILAVAVVTIGIGAWIGRLAFEDIILAAVGFAVAAIPEGLPAIVTIILAYGVRRMAARGALIRKLPAVETLGSVDVICTDKTGTLTRNELVARAVVTGDASLAVEGEGYGPDGTVHDESGNVPSADAGGVFARLLAAAVLCNDARLSEGEGGWVVEGDPVEGALLALGNRAGAPQSTLKESFHRIDVLPFESDHRFMATLDQGASGNVVHVKGAPERILELCTIEQGADGTRAIDRDAWHKRIDKLAAEGLRVLAFASTEKAGATLSRDRIGDDLAFLGLVGFIDAPRIEAREAVETCRRAGIAVKMITGDHAATALAVGEAVGLDVSGGALTGPELALLDDDALAAVVERTAIFARIDPAQKLRLVEALQRGGHAVAMTGDGVNDAPALRRADIGVAMGKKGSDAARAAADMVLVDDNFATVAVAVSEGRSVDDNLRKALRYVLPTNAGEAILLIGAILTGATLPITAIQIIWINFATEITLSLSLAFEPRSAKGMKRKPRHRGEGLIVRRDLVRIIVVSIGIALVAGGVFWWADSSGRPIEEARAITVNAVVAAEIAYLLATATLWPRKDTEGINLVAIGMIVAVSAAQLLVTQVTPIAKALGMSPLTLLDWGVVVVSGVFILVGALLAQRIQRGREPAVAEPS